MDNDFELDADLLAVVEQKFPKIIDLDALHEEETDPSADEGPEDEEPDQEEPDATEPAGEPEQEPEPGTGEPEPSASGDAQLIELAPGVTIPKDQALAYYQFDAILRGDEELQKLIDERVRGQATGDGETRTQQQTPSPSPLPELTEEDLEDPTIAALYNTAKQQQEYLQSVEQRLSQLSDVTITREAEEITSLIQTTKANYATAHNLTSDEVEKVAAVAERLELVPALLKGVDPVTGEVVPRDRTAVLTRALDIAYWYLPEFRERELSQQVTERAKSARRKQRLAGVSGTSGSVPKGTPQPQNEQQRRQAMIADVAEMLGQNREE